MHSISNFTFISDMLYSSLSDQTVFTAPLWSHLVNACYICTPYIVIFFPLTFVLSSKNAAFMITRTKQEDYLINIEYSTGLQRAYENAFVQYVSNWVIFWVVD